MELRSVGFRCEAVGPIGLWSCAGLQVMDRHALSLPRYMYCTLSWNRTNPRSGALTANPAALCRLAGRLHLPTPSQLQLRPLRALHFGHGNAATENPQQKEYNSQTMLRTTRWLRLRNYNIRRPPMFQIFAAAPLCTTLRRTHGLSTLIGHGRHRLRDGRITLPRRGLGQGCVRLPPEPQSGQILRQPLTVPNPRRLPVCVM
jgi:hypothetical protein